MTTPAPAPAYTFNPSTLALLTKYLGPAGLSRISKFLPATSPPVGASNGAAPRNLPYGFGQAAPSLGTELPDGGVPNDIQKALGLNFNKGTQFQDMDPATKQYIENAVAADKNSTQHSPSILSRALDIISRPEYATAGAYNAVVQRITNDGVQHKGLGTIIKDAIIPSGGELEQAGTNVVQGIEGKQKFSYSTDLANASKQLGVKEGLPEKVLGVADDVILDPTNFVGGGVSKVGKIGEILKTSEDVGKFADTAKVAADAAGVPLDPNVFKKTLLDPKLLNASKEAKRAALGTAIDGTVTPAAQAVALNVSKAAEPVITKQVTETLAKNGMRVFDTKNVADLKEFIATKYPAGFAGNSGKLLADIGSNNKTVEEAIAKGVAEAPETKEAARQGAIAAEKVSDEGAKLVDRAINPASRKQFVIKAGGKKIIGLTPTGKVFDKVPLLAKPYDKIAAKLTNDEGLAQRAITGWYRGFSARNLTKDVDGIRARYGSGHPVVAVNAQAQADREAFGTLSKSEREASLQALRDGSSAASPAGGNDVLKDGLPVGNVSDYIEKRIDDIQNKIEAHPVIGRTEFLNKLASDFPKAPSTYPEAIKTGRSGSPDTWLKDAILKNKDGVFTKTAKNRDPVQVLHTLESAFARADAHASMLGELTERHGVKSTHKGYENYLKAGYTVPKYRTGEDGVRGLKYLKDPETAFDPAITKQIEYLHELHMSPQKMSQFWRNFDKAQRAFKTSVTKYTPGFHSRNFQTEQLMNAMHGVYDNPFAGVQDLRQALKVMKIHGHSAVDGLTDLPSTLSRRDALKYNRIRQGVNTGKFDSALQKALDAAPKETGSKVIFKSHGNNVTADMIHSAYNEFGVRSGFMSSDFRKGLSKDKNLAMRTGHKINNVASAVGEAVETAPRMQHFIHSLKKELKLWNGKGDFRKIYERAVENSAAEVRLAHFDYTDLTPLERSTFKRLIPFYTFTRKAIPSFLAMGSRHPGRVLALPRIEAGISEGLGYNRDQSKEEFPEGDFVVPEWLRDDHAVPLYGSGGTTKYLDASADPVTGIGNLVPHPTDPGSYGNALRMLTPALTLPFQIEQKKALNGAPIKSTLDFLKTQNPLVSNYGKVTQGASPTDTGSGGSPINNSALLQFLLGLGIHDNTLSGQQATARQEEVAALAKQQAQRAAIKK